VVSSGYRLANPRFAPAINRSALPRGSISDLRRRPIFQLCLPTQPTSLIGVRSLTCLPVDFQLALVTNYPAWPSGRASTCVSDPPSGFAFRSVCDLRRLLLFRLAFGLGFELAPSTRSSSLTFQLLSSLRLRSTFRFRLRIKPPTLIGRRSLRRCPPVDLRLAPPIFPPALPDGSHVRHRRLHLRFQLSGSSPTCVFDLPVSPNLELDLRFVGGLDAFGAALRLTFGLRRRSSFRPCLRT